MVKAIIYTNKIQTPRAHRKIVRKLKRILLLPFQILIAHMVAAQECNHINFSFMHHQNLNSQMAFWWRIKKSIPCHQSQVLQPFPTVCYYVFLFFSISLSNNVYIILSAVKAILISKWKIIWKIIRISIICKNKQPQVPAHVGDLAQSSWYLMKPVYKTFFC